MDANPSSDDEHDAQGEDRGSDEGERVLSQREYRPTPYRDSNWEVIGERLGSEFQVLMLSVLPGEGTRPDPMFEVFERPLQAGEQIAHGNIATQGFGVVKEAASDSGLAPEALASVLEGKYSEGYEAGLQAGRADTEAKMADSYQSITRRSEETLSNIAAGVQAFFGRTEEQAVRLALEVAKKILMTTADIRPQYIHEVIKEGLLAAPGGKAVRIRVAPQDLEFLEVVGLPVELAATEPKLQFVADDDIKAGCVLEGEFGEVDVQLERMWERVRDEIYSKK